METQPAAITVIKEGAAARKDPVRRVLITRRCNQACAFCDRVSASVGDLPLEILRGEVELASRSADEVVLSGGEPLLHPGVYELIRLAHAHGARHVAMDTNATLITPAVAALLVESGLSSVAVTVVATTPEGHRRHSASSTELADLLAGIHACINAGIGVSVSLPIARNLVPAADRLRYLKEAIPALKSFALAPTGLGSKTLLADQALKPAEQSQEMVDCVDVAAELGVDLCLSRQRVVAPCIVDLPAHARQLWLGQLRWEGSTTRNDVHEACSRCALAQRCVLNAEQFARSAGTRAPRPLTDARIDMPVLRRDGLNPGRLKVLGAAEVENFYHVDYEYPDGVEVEKPTSRVGIIYRCNQVCTFCQLAEMDTHLSPEKIRAAINASRERGSVRLIITGGEPTLSPHLFDYIRYAKDKGFEILEMQTNAVVVDRPGFADRLRQAGLTHAQVSLHGPDGAISDRLTAAPGTHRRTLKGVDALLKAGVHVLLNHLIFKENCHLLVDFVDLVETRWSAHRSQLTIQFHAAMNEFEHREDALLHIARYSDYAPTLLRAFDRMIELGYPAKDLQDPTGIPALCVLKANPNYLGPILNQRERPRFHKWETRWLTRVDACSRCDAAEMCMGVPRHYVKLYGESEFSPIKLPPPKDS